MKPFHHGLNKDCGPGASFKKKKKNSSKPNTSVRPNFVYGFGKELILTSKDPKGKGLLVSLSLGASSENQEVGLRERMTGESSRDAGRVSVGAPGGVLAAEACTKTRCSVSKKLPDFDKDKFSSVDLDIELSHRVNTHVVSILAVMEAMINDDMLASY